MLNTSIYWRGGPDVLKFCKDHHQIVMLSKLADYFLSSLKLPENQNKFGGDP